MFRGQDGSWEEQVGGPQDHLLPHHRGPQSLSKTEGPGLLAELASLGSLTGCVSCPRMHPLQGVGHIYRQFC